jgi:hypothetical protein
MRIYQNETAPSNAELDTHIFCRNRRNHSEIRIRFLWVFLLKHRKASTVPAFLFLKKLFWFRNNYSGSEYTLPKIYQIRQDPGFYHS